MICRITELHNKEVINLDNGNRLGCVDDVEVDSCTARLCAIVIHGHPRLLGLGGHEPDIVIQWEDIAVIGDETILVHFKCPPPQPCCRRGGLLHDLLGRR
ncbi:MAG: YlmC/YmxH family sporulation protein [Clostridia bacterium]|nr:YlmC/YmxH family sporulation protein [Clostridia bacterium]